MEMLCKLNKWTAILLCRLERFLSYALALVHLECREKLWKQNKSRQV